MFCTRFCYITLDSTQLGLFALNCIFCTQLHLFTLNFIYMHSIAFICTQLDLFALNWMYSYHKIEFCDSVQNLPKNVLPPAKMVCSTQLASSIFVTRMRTTKVVSLAFLQNLLRLTNVPKRFTTTKASTKRKWRCTATGNLWHKSRSLKTHLILDALSFSWYQKPKWSLDYITRG